MSWGYTTVLFSLIKAAFSDRIPELITITSSPISDVNRV